jgi:hypothetical protein
MPLTPFHQIGEVSSEYNPIRYFKGEPTVTITFISVHCGDFPF